MLTPRILGAAGLVGVGVAEGTYDITSAATTADETYNASGTTGSNNLYISFNAAGTKMFLSNGTTVYRFSLSTAWQISSGVTYDTNSGAINGSTGFWIKADGTELYSTNNGSTIYQQTMSTAWDLSTLSNTGNVAIGAKPRGIALDSTGVKGLVYDDQSTAIEDIALSAAWDITTATFTGNSRVITGNEGFACSLDGTHVYTGKASVEQDDFSTGWDASTGSDIGTNALDANDNRGMFIGDNGSSFYVSTNSGALQRYYLT